MAVSRRLRFEVLRRDEFTCRYCGASAPDVRLHVDHVIPETLGGGDDPTNLVTACADCNSGKSSIAPDSALVADVDATALLFAKAIERAADARRAAMRDEQAQLDHFDEMWCSWTCDDKTLERPNDWRTSIARFMANGLTLEDMDVFVRQAMESTGVPPHAKFLSFCKRCWRELEERHEDARRLIEDGEV